ncbi:MAG TPA: hypothetical protein VF502_13075 [Stellaceae bacterium]
MPRSSPAPARSSTENGTSIVALPGDEDAAAALLERAVRRLARRDKRLAAVVKAVGPCRLRRAPGGFPRLFQAILRQQLSGKAAATIAARVHAACGGIVAAEAVAALDDAAFARAGVSRQKRDYLRGLAAMALASPTIFDELEALPDDAAIAALITVKGIGRWTADMYLMFALGRLDVLPLGDLSIRAAITEIYGLRSSARPAEFAAVAEVWRPYRSIVSWYFYAYLDRDKQTSRAK